MILFCDTSALMKLYAREQHSDWTRQQVLGAERCLVNQITWAEMCAALALKARTGQIAADEVPTTLTRLRKEWDGYIRLGLDAALIGSAGELALTFGLRAYDSVQLASAQAARQLTGKTLHFCCFDRQLNTAARALGLNLVEPVRT